MSPPERLPNGDAAAVDPGEIHVALCAGPRRWQTPPVRALLLLSASLCACPQWLPPRGGDDDDSATGVSPDDDDTSNDDDATANDDDATANDDDATPACPDPLPAELITVDDACRVDVAITQDPTLEIVWQVSSFVDEPCFTEVMMTPLVLPLTDDDGDGVASAGDERAVLFSTFCGSDYSGAGVIRALSGDGTTTLWSQTDAAWRVQPDAALAAGDLDGDGWPEIVAVNSSHHLMALDRFGVGLWQASEPVPPGGERGGAFLADLDGDGNVEILFGNQIYDAAGTLMATGAHGRGSNNARPEFPTSFAVDADLDGVQEVVVGNALYDAAGGAIWFNGQPDGFPAVGNFDGDPEAEFVVVFSNQVRLQDTDGTVIAGPVTLPGSGSGGPPTVADFDGDGAPEIGVANLAYYAVLDTDLSLLWSNPTQDLSSSITGSSAFDFDGDGDSEVVYSDEIDVWVWDGATGDVIFQGDGHASGTHLEYPVVAQVIDDGPPQIVVGSNNLSGAGWTGITLLSDVGRAWVSTRGVWNQHAFMPTYINDDLSVPAAPQMPWLVGQGFRQNEVTTLPGVAAPDLSLELDSWCDLGLPDELLLRVRPVNDGVAAGPFDVLVEREIDGVVLGLQSMPGLGSGSIGASLEFALDPALVTSTLIVTIDPAVVVEECDETNNELILGDGP